MDTEDTDGQWIQGISRYSGYRWRVERIQTGTGYTETVDIVDADGKWIQRIQADSGYRESVDIVDTDGEWRGYRRTVDTEDTGGPRSA